MKLPIAQYFQLLSTYLRPQRKRVMVFAFLILATIGFQLFAPQIVRWFIDEAQSGAALPTLIQTGLFFLVVTFMNQIFRFGAAYVTEDIKWRATNWLQNDLAAHCMKLDMSFHNEFTPSSMIERTDGDVQELSNFLPSLFYASWAMGFCTEWHGRNQGLQDHSSRSQSD